MKAGRVPMGTVITEKEYESLRLMLHSSDEANWEVVRQVLNGCDDQASIYWIWMLSRRGFAGRMVNLRTKASRAFQESVNLHRNSWNNEEEFAQWLIEKGWMTEEIFQKLKPHIYKLIANRAQNLFFDIHATICTRFQHYDPSNKQDLISPVKK
jgi:hypothetical protein